jgi:hypothetical protein
MPSSSKKQHNFMEAVAHSPAFAKKVGVPQSVGQDFNKADKGRKFSKGGDTMATKLDPRVMQMMAAKAAANRAPMKRPMPAPAMGGRPMPAEPMAPAMKKGGMTKKMAGGGLAAGHKSADGIASKGKTKGTNIAMKKGGKVC